MERRAAEPLRSALSRARKRDRRSRADRTRRERAASVLQPALLPRESRGRTRIRAALSVLRSGELRLHDGEPGPQHARANRHVHHLHLGERLGARFSRYRTRPLSRRGAKLRARARMTTGVHETKDAYLGLENPTWEQWHGWHRSMLEERGSVLARCNFHPGVYDDPGTAWSDTSFRQLFLFMYDASFFDCIQGCYRTAELVDASLERFGRIDSVLLWHAYPRLGFDLRTQFDFYRDMPGGMAKLRSDVTDVLHARGVRVFVGYNPWDEGAYEELAQIVRELDADGVMLDTMAGVPPELEQTVRAAKESVVFAPELAPRDEDLRRLRQSWAQWSEVGEGPTIYRHRWLVPRHRQLAVRRWDTSRKRDIVHSFFNGSGLILWDNVFGTWNPYSREDRRLIAETAAILDQYGDLFVHGEWLPLIPTGTSGLDANCWRDAGGSGRSILTLRNRTEERVHYRVPDDAPEGLVQVAFWGDEPREL